MKVIDLLNKIAKGKEVPKEIKYDTMNYYFRNYDYKEVHGELIDEQTSFIERINFYRLNDEIEIIEEKEIKELGELEYYKITDETISGLRRSINTLNEDYTNKINELVREINKIKKEGKNNESSNTI